ncbi:MAG: MFS transporter [Lachnospiraceae bacterium]|nr:MFS transporter [Lachnospiraceae bacterium]
MAKEKKAKNPDHLGFGRLMAWKSSDIVAAWINILMLNYLSIYASDTLGVNVGVVGSLLLASKVVDGFTDVAAGYIVDNTKSKWGKGRPYELGIVGMTICTIGLFAASPAWSTFFKCAWIFCMYTLTFSLFSTFRATAGNPYTIRHFSNNKALITKVASYGGIITMAGSIIMNALIPVMMGTIATSASGWTAMVAIIMVPATAIGVLRFLFCKEDPSVDASVKKDKIEIKEIIQLITKNKYVWLYAIIMLCYNISTNLAVGTYYWKWIVGDITLMSITSVFSVILLPLMLLFPVISKKIGIIGRMITVFGIVGIAGYAFMFLSNGSVVGALAGSLFGTFATLPLAYYGVLFIMNICTYNEMIGLPRMDGSSAILSNFATKAGAALGSWITGILLMVAGYVSAEGVAEQPASALLMIRIDASLVPAFCLAIICFCCLAFSKLEKMVPEWEAKKKAESEAAGAADAVEVKAE